MQIQLNYMDWDNPRVCSGELYEILHERGVPIVVMEPVKGGNLASLRPQEQAILERARPGASAASWALRFAAGLDGVMTVLSGMSTIGQVQENLDTFAALAPLAEDERAALAEVVRAVQALPVTGCTGCSYCCEGCPQNIPIPIALRAMDEMRQYPGNASAPRLYGLRTKDRGVAADCNRLRPVRKRVPAASAHHRAAARGERAAGRLKTWKKRTVPALRKRQRGHGFFKNRQMVYLPAL